MAVKIRLMRIGTNKKPFYRVVAVDERRKRTGGYLELLGTYNPLTEPKEINLRQDRIDEWIKKGAIPSYGFLRIIGKAPQRVPRKAKKQKKEVPTTETSSPTEEPKASDEPKAIQENSDPENLDKAEDQKTSESETATSEQSNPSESSENSSEPKAEEA